MVNARKKIKVQPKKISFRIYIKDNINVKLLRNLYGLKEETFGFLNQHIGAINISEWDEKDPKYLEYDRFLREQYGDMYSNTKSALPEDYLFHPQRIIILCYYTMREKEVLVAGMTLTIADEFNTLRFEDEDRGGLPFIEKLKEAGNDVKVGGIGEIGAAAVKKEFRATPLISAQTFNLTMLICAYLKVNGIIDKGACMSTSRTASLYKNMFKRTFGLKADEVEQMLIPLEYCYVKNDEIYLTIFRADRLEGSDLMRIMEKQRGLVQMEDVLRKKFNLQSLAEVV